ncbi:MAG TPA: protein O-GlcNAcase [Bacillota bacterium]
MPRFNLPARIIAGALALALAVSGCTLPGLTRRPSTPVKEPPAVVAPPSSTPPDQPADGAVWIDATKSPFAVRGIVEGFYGQPWTQAQRLAAFDFMARVGLNTYVYAPKDDPYQRQDWRTAYPAAEVARFSALLARARGDKVDFVYSISPGLNITYSSKADRDALATKVDQLRGLGIETFMLSVDDVPEKLTPADAALYGQNYALAQADLANWLYRTERAKDPGFTLWMTPSHYWGTKADSYLTSLGGRLAAAIPLIWTGPGVLSRTITAKDADAFAAIVKRKAIVWDNYPVNDYTYVQQKLHSLILGPLRGRDAKLAGHVGGYLINPLIQAEASRLPLYTAAAYLADPSRYDPAAAWTEAAGHLAVCGPGGQVLLKFASYARSSVVYDSEAPGLAKVVADYWRGAASAPAALEQELTAMAELPQQLAAATSPGLYDDIAPWAVALRDKGRAGLLAVKVDQAVNRRDAAGVKADLPKLRQSLADIKTEDAKAYIAAGYVETFIGKVIDRAKAITG